jgi:hypothetical protein
MGREQGERTSWVRVPPSPINLLTSDEAIGRVWPCMLTLVVARIVVAAVPWLTGGRYARGRQGNA